jgi:hypothetical protein
VANVAPLTRSDPTVSARSANHRECRIWNGESERCDEQSERGPAFNIHGVGPSGPMRIVSFAFKDERSPLNEAAYVRCHRGAVRLLFLLSTAINPARAAQIQATTARTERLRFCRCDCRPATALREGRCGLLMPFAAFAHSVTPAMKSKVFGRPWAAVANRRLQCGSRRSCSRSLLRWTLPVAVRGKSWAISNRRGRL